MMCTYKMRSIKKYEVNDSDFSPVIENYSSTSSGNFGGSPALTLSKAPPADDRNGYKTKVMVTICLLYTSPSPRD